MMDDITVAYAAFWKWAGTKSMAFIRRRDGFKGQRQFVIPRATLALWEKHPMLQALIPTDIGWYPSAEYHYREREQGADEHILIFCVCGMGWYEIDGGQRSLQSNEALVIPRGVPHAYGASEESPWSIHWVHFKGTQADYFAGQLPDGENSLLVDLQARANIENLFYECYDSFVGGFVLHRLIFCAQILHHLLGTLFFSNNAFSPMQRTSRFHSLEGTIAYMQQHICTSLTLADLANYAGLSVSHFSWLFRQQLGYSPIDYFIHLKMQHACALLALSQRSIHEIAAELGYDDPYYFSRTFKKVMGISPREYRQSPKG